MACSKFNFRDSPEYEAELSVTIGYDYVTTVTQENADFTGYIISMEIYDKDGNILLTLSTVGDRVSTGIYIADPASGSFDIQMTDTTSATFTEGDYPYQLKLVQPNTQMFPFMSGEINFREP